MNDRKVSPWKHTEKDRKWNARKVRATARDMEHVYDASRCKPGCVARLRGEE